MGEDVVVIRPFRVADQDAARALILEGLVEHWGWLDATKNPDLDDIGASYGHGVFLVAYRGERLVGTGALVPEAEGQGRIVRMSVSSGERRQGIGRRLLERLLEEARVAGYRRVVLETTATWEDVVGFYRRCGFRPVGERDGDLHFERELD